MDSEDFERMMEGAEETDVLEFKQAMAWDVRALVKDILAMANVRDGGRIVFGIEDQTYVRQGLSDVQMASFNQDIMRDQVAPYADPRVVFRVLQVEDRNGLKFAVIEVAPFDLEPVICRRDGADVAAGRIYFRSKARRPQSAAIADSSDMRQILLRSASLLHKNIEEHGYRLDIAADNRLVDELEGL